MNEFVIKKRVLEKYNEQKGKTIVEIPEGVTIIGYLSFCDCTNLTEISIPSSVTMIGSYSFYGCTSLNELKIPKGVIVIDNNAFSNCINLKRIIIPQSVTEIGYDVFDKCRNLEDIIIYSYSTLELLDHAHKIIALTSFIKNYLIKRIEYTKEDIEKFKNYIKRVKKTLLKVALKNPYVMYFLLNEMGVNFITYDVINDVINKCANKMQPLDIKSIALLREYIKNNYDNEIDKQKKIGKFKI